MPIRIKPSHDLGPCILTLDSIKKIIGIVEKDFPAVICSASDKVWEIYHEVSGPFLNAISQRETLDSFRIEAQTEFEDVRIKLVFNEDKAKVTCVAKPEDEHWFEHFLIDIKNSILPPYYKQLFIHKYGKGEISFKIPFVFLPLIDTRVVGSTPYCRIIIRQKPPSPFIENIKANLVSNIIWLVAGGILLFVLQWIFRKYGVDLNPFD